MSDHSNRWHRFAPVPLSAFAALWFLSFAQPASAQQNGTLIGTVVHEEHADAHEDREPITLGEAQVIELARQVRVGDDATFRFDEVPAGTYNVVVIGPAGTGIATVVLEAGQTLEFDVEVLVSSHFDEMVVTGSGEIRSAFEMTTPTHSLSGEELIVRDVGTLGETLASTPGVNSSFFGMGAGRPIIRGQAGDRIAVLEDGLGTGDVSSVSPDHAVTTDPLLAESLEVIRGPATLLYGSSAIGGAVNVIDDRVPSLKALSPIGGRVALRGGTVAKERAGALSLDGGAGNWAFRFDGSTRDSDDYDIPGFANVEHSEEEEHEEDEENPYGTLPNSDVSTTNVRVGASYFFGDKGFVGAAVSGFETEYGLPGAGTHGHEEGEEQEEEAPVRIDMEQRRLDLRSEIRQGFGIFRGLRIRFGATDYEHRELEGAEVGTTFLNDSLQGRFEMIQQRRGISSGSIGLQLSSRDLEAIGDEAFIPPNQTDRLALFTFQEIETGNLSWQFGLRWENQDLSATGFDDRSDDALSGSAGLSWTFAENWSLAASVARSVKLPIAEELYSDGLHVATQAYEIGNPLLEDEVGLGFDVSLRKRAGRFEGELSLFRNAFTDYIYQAFTGEEREGFPVVVYSQADATFEGAELSTRFELLRIGNGDLHLNVGGDMVEATLDDPREGESPYLPRIPPRRAWLGLHYHSPRWNGRIETRWVDDQTDLAENETPTNGYTLLNASIGRTVLLKQQSIDIILRGTNLTNEDARRHTSYLKDSVPLPGRDLNLFLRLSF